MRRRPLIGSIVLGLLLEASAAQAHIRLQYPTPRYPAPAVEDGSNLKIAPCGAANDSRTTDATRITTFTPGQQIQVKWAETIGHPGHYRIAFDDNGQDNLIDPASYTDIVNPPVLPILLDGIPDVAGNGTYTETITLPNIVCSNCTLQVIQVMTDKAPYVINTNDVYHQCADIVLAGPLLASGGAAGAGGTTGDAGSSGAGAGDGGAAGTGTAGTGTAGAGTAGAGTAGVGTAGAAGSPSAGSAGLPDQPEPTADMQQLPSGTSGGCALSPRSSGHELALAGLLLGALAAQRRRRQLPGGKLVR